MTNLEYQEDGLKREGQQMQRDDDDYAPFTNAMMDTQSPGMSPRTDLRRGSSFTEPTSAFATSTAWTGFALNAASNDTGSRITDDIFLRSRGQTLPNIPAAHASAFTQHPATWSVSGTSDSFVPAASNESLEFGESPTSPFAPANVHLTPGLSFDSININAANNYHQGPSFPTSPHSCKEGWISGSSSDGLDYRNIPHLVHPQSPSFATNTQLLRRDGIRKKNARFEIPAERNLRTIDQLINQTSDEQELKELKQQKRLLRNRQAALDSRQRKKQHTERLEEEKKHYTAVISDLEDALSDFRVQEGEWAREKEAWLSSQHQYQQCIENFIMEKEEMLRRHTIETGELRKKNAILIEQLNHMDATAMSNVASSAGYSAEFSDYDQVPMNPWEDFPVTNAFSIEAERPSAREAVRTPKTTLGEPSSQGDKAVASGFLLMLLLCGAWMASRAPGSNPIPAIPDDMKAASATVLDNLYKGSGIELDGVTGTASRMVPVQKAIDTTSPKTTLSASEFAGLSRPSLDSLHQSLTAPTAQQLQQQAFSLTSAQYQDLVGGDTYPSSYLRNENPKNVGDILGATQDFLEGSAAETYAKSLLKDKVSTRVLQDFARMVTQSRADSHVPWKSEQIG